MSLRFYEDEHKYFFKNRELSGITSVIGRELGISYLPMYRIFKRLCLEEVPFTKKLRTS